MEFLDAPGGNSLDGRNPCQVLSEYWAWRLTDYVRSGLTIREDAPVLAPRSRWKQTQRVAIGKPNRYVTMRVYLKLGANRATRLEAGIVVGCIPDTKSYPQSQRTVLSGLMSRQLGQRFTKARLQYYFSFKKTSFP